MASLKVHNGGSYALMGYLTCWKCAIFMPILLLVNVVLLFLKTFNFKILVVDAQTENWNIVVERIETAVG